MKKILFIALLLIAIFCTAFCVTATIMWGRTGSPGETTCVSCHSSYPINSGGGSMQIATIPSMSGNQYTPGLTYTINVTVARPSYSYFQCDVEVLDSIGNNTGTLINTSSNTQLKTYLPNGRINVFGSGNNLGYFTFSFNWIAPPSGEVNIYTTGMQPNSDGTNIGDYVYSDSLVHLKPVSTSGINSTFNTQPSTINIYPNPASSSLQVTFSGNIQNTTLQITDMLGNTIYHSTLNTQHKIISVSDLAEGVYTIGISSKEGVVNKRLVIVR